MGVPRKKQHHPRTLQWEYSPMVVREGEAVLYERGTRVQLFLGPLGFNFSQHGPTTRPSRRKDCRESIYALRLRVPLGHSASKLWVSGLQGHLRMHGYEAVTGQGLLESQDTHRHRTLRYM